MYYENTSITEKIAWAEDIYSKFGDLILRDSEVQRLLNILDRSIDATYTEMETAGTLEECTKCAQKTGSCCSRKIDKMYDKRTLLINRLMGVELPKEREIEDGCFFQGMNGCKIRAREIICVDYFCPRMYDIIEREKMVRLQNVAGEEHETLFKLSDRINTLLLKMNL
ncbi:MAG: hypothetical protein ACLFO6_06605 [Archaeoglobaceae archaeon]